MKKALICVLKIATFFIGWVAVLDFVLPFVPEDNELTWRFLSELIPLVVIVIFTIIFQLVERGRVKVPVTPNIGKGSLIGAITGTIWIGLSAGILIATDQLVIDSKNAVSYLGLWAIITFINTVMQELLVRGYIYQLLKKEYSVLVSTIVTTAFFTLLHGGMLEAGLLPVINVATMSLFATALYESERTIMAPIMAHAVWNFVGGVILGGVSLAEDYPHVYSLTAAGNPLFSGGQYKMEGSLVTMILNIALAVLFFMKRKKAESSVS